MQNWKIAKLRSRVEQLERSSSIRREPAPVFVITFVKSDGAGHPGKSHVTWGELGGRKFDRQPGETEEEFVDRIMSTQEHPPYPVFLHCD